MKGRREKKENQTIHIRPEQVAAAKFQDHHFIQNVVFRICILKLL